MYAIAILNLLEIQTSTDNKNKKMVKKFLHLVLSKTKKQIRKRLTQNEKKILVINDFQYSAVTPAANYSPWLADSEFSKIYLEIKSHTLVDIFRCYELWELTEHIHNLNSNAAFIEVGVWKGGTAGIIAKKLSLLGSNVAFFLADTFEGVVKATDKDSTYNGSEHADTSQEIVENLLSNKYHKYTILKGIFPDDTSHLIDDTIQFGFCHIDVDVYESSKDIVDWIWSRMIKGGVLVFDDYGFHTCDGVTKYVNEQKNKSDRVIVHNLNGHALMIKL
jgi:O-methyltransferase